MIKRIIITIVAGIIGYSGMLLSVSPISAQSQYKHQVSPARYEKFVSRGEQFSYPVTFSNLTDTPLSGSLSVEYFTVEKGTSTPLILYDQTGSWVSLPSSHVTIGPLDKVTVDVQVRVPEDAPPGGHYETVLFTTANESEAPAEEAPASRFSTAIGSLLVITVEGAVTHAVTIENLQVPKMLEYGPIPLSFRLTNGGNTHTQAQAHVSVKDMFGAQIDEVSLEKLSLFPENWREFDLRAGKDMMMGAYSVDINVVYGPSIRDKVHSINVWIIPYKIIAFILLSLVLLVFMVQRIRRHIHTDSQS